ncbi:MAG: ribonuclease Z [Candidatus Omnitrophota bacterium]|nr:ribonuclease Z [Candidatus Omnitrophota bacterium]
MKIVFLGTNGWYNTTLANTTCIFIETEGHYIIFDAGDGLYKIDRFIKQAKPIHLFLSHFHLDHITGLHTLNKFNFPQGLKIYGQKGIREFLTRVICSPYSVDISKLLYKVDLLEIEEGYHRLPFLIECRRLRHSTECFGYRLEINNKVITYCPDTGVCDNAMILARDADLVMCECSLRSGQDNKAWPHLNPELAAQIANKAKAKKMALIHFNPHFYPSTVERRIAEQEAKRIFNNSFQAVDDLEIFI